MWCAANASWSANSRTRASRGFPIPWPARVSTESRIGPASVGRSVCESTACWSAAANLNECAGTTRSSWSPVVMRVPMRDDPDARDVDDVSRAAIDESRRPEKDAPGHSRANRRGSSGRWNRTRSDAGSLPTSWAIRRPTRQGPRRSRHRRRGGCASPIRRRPRRVGNVDAVQRLDDDGATGGSGGGDDSILPAASDTARQNRRDA